MRHSTLLTVVFLLAVSLLCSVFNAFPAEKREECRLCGMWIDQYLHTRHVLTAEGEPQVSFCSFSCAAKYLNRHPTKVKRLQVADFLTTELLDVKDAVYLIGSDAPPVMSFISVIAFAGKETAENFQSTHGGRIMTFSEALALKQQGEL